MSQANRSVGVLTVVWHALTLCLGMTAVGSARADGLPRLPSLQGPNAQTVTLDGVKTFKLHPDSSGAKRLVIEPNSLMIARDSKGQPMVQVDLWRDVVEDQSKQAEEAAGMVSLAVCIGYDNYDQFLKRIREEIDARYPEYRGWALDAVSFLAGTGESGFQVGDSSRPYSMMPVAAPTGIGAQIAFHIPITKQQGEVIRRRIAESQGGSLSLKTNIHYKADVTFATEPVTIHVEAEREAVFTYLEKILRTTGGFLFFSWAYQKHEIHEELTKTHKMVSKLVGYKGTQPPQAYLDMLKQAEDRAITFISEIDVDKTGKTPDIGYERREHGILFFAPWFFINSSIWAGLGYGEEDIKRKAKGTYNYDATFQGSVDIPVSLMLESFEVPRDAVAVIDMDKAYYTTQIVTVNPFRADLPRLWNDHLKSAQVTVRVGDADQPDQPVQQLVFDFNHVQNQTLSDRFYRNAWFERIGNHGLFRAVLPPLSAEATVITRNQKIVVGPIPVNASTSRLRPVTIDLDNYINLVTVDGSALFRADRIRSAQVELRWSNAPSRSLTLEKQRPTVVLLEENSERSNPPAIRVRVEDRKDYTPWGSFRTPPKADIKIVESDLDPTARKLLEDGQDSPRQ
jgi:hypothetical protein